MGDIEHSNEHMAGWAMQELSRSGATFSERVEARKIIGEIVKQADAYRGAVELLRELSEKWTDVRVSGNAARVTALGDAVRRARELTDPGGQ